MQKQAWTYTMAGTVFAAAAVMLRWLQVQTIFDAETGELLGAHMVGAQVTEQIQGFGIARHLEATDESLLSMIFAHPTLSEAMHESILAACDQPLHQ